MLQRNDEYTTKDDPKACAKSLYLLQAVLWSQIGNFGVRYTLRYQDHPDGDPGNGVLDHPLEEDRHEKAQKMKVMICPLRLHCHCIEQSTGIWGKSLIDNCVHGMEICL